MTCSVSVVCVVDCHGGMGCVALMTCSMRRLLRAQAGVAGRGASAINKPSQVARELVHLKVVKQCGTLTGTRQSLCVCSSKYLLVGGSRRIPFPGLVKD
jgi:hypothetical protein